MERSRPLAVTLGEGAVMQRKFFNLVVVRSIEETVEIVVEAPTASDAHAAALEHLRAVGDEYHWSNPRRELTVWHKREIDTPAIVDVTFKADR